MSSEFKPSNVRALLKDTIKPHLPTRWKLFPTLTSPEKLNVPAVYFEFTDISNEMAGKALAPGNVAANFDLSVVLPGSLSAKAEDNADAAVLALIQALDNSDQLFWGPSAIKVVLSTGQIGWSVPVSILTSTLPESPQE